MRFRGSRGRGPAILGIVVVIAAVAVVVGLVVARYRGGAPTAGGVPGVATATQVATSGVTAVAPVATAAPTAGFAEPEVDQGTATPSAAAVETSAPPVGAAGTTGPPPTTPVTATAPSPLATAITAGEPAYSNPVLNQDFPDPTVIRAADGRYYAYATQRATPEGAVNIQVAVSADLVRWRVLGDALPDGAPWAGETQAYWAPHVYQAGGRYYLYYSAQPEGTEDTHCLGVAMSRSPAGPFRDKGEPFHCGDTGSDIDPMVFRDPKTRTTYVYWGSGGVITAHELARDGLSLAPEGVSTQLLFGGDYEYEGAEEDVVEGPWVVYREPYYYLFYSGDNCCAYPAHYAVLVARATDPTGPFEKLAAATETEKNTILEASGRWNGPGHGSVVTDAAGRDWFAYHAIDTGNPAGAGGEGVRRVMLLDPVEYRDGWPRIGTGTPSEGVAERPAAR